MRILHQEHTYFVVMKFIVHLSVLDWGGPVGFDDYMHDMYTGQQQDYIC